MSLTSTFSLANGVEIPVVGFGTWQTPDGEVAYQSVKKALEVGYRHIDTAAIYGNEVSVGKAINDSGIPREELFITTKIWATATDYETAKVAIEESLKRLNLDYVDMLLIHWPNPANIRPNYEARNSGVWQAMEEAYEAGKIRALGISNFQKHHIDALLKTAKIKPVVNQIYVNPSDQQEELVAYNKSLDILTEAYSPLGTGDIFKVRELGTLAEKYGKTVAQVVLRWHLQKGYLSLPKSVTPARIEENTKIFDFEISPEDIAIIDDLHGALTPYKNPDKAPF